MSIWRRVRPQLETLEHRLPPTASIAEPPPDSSGSEVAAPIDPTEDPIDPGNMTVSAQVVAMGAETDGLVHTITVSGAGITDVVAGPVQVQIGEVVYGVDSVAVLENGNITLTFAAGVDALALTDGADVVLIVGDGGQEPIVTDPVGEPPPPEPPIDPTEMPIE